MKKVSVIITSYNAEKTIQRAVDSVFRQEGINKEFAIELIVVDDCSKDKTVEILTANGIDYLSTGVNSGGPNKGRNMGLRKASGDFICIMDHDDEWNSDKMIRQLEAVEKAPIVTCGYTLINEVNSNTIDRVQPGTGSPDFHFRKNETFFKCLTRSNVGQNTYLGSILFHRSLITFFEEHFGMLDFDWLLKLFKDQHSVEVCKPLYRRYFSSSNLSLNENYRRKDFYFSLMTVEEYRKEFPREARRGWKKLHGSYARYFYYTEDMKMARFFFRQSSMNVKTLMYYLTSFYGYRFVNRKFSVFG